MNVGRGLVLVRPAETEESIPGGRIILPETAREKMTANQMFIISVGLPEFCDDEDCPRKHDIFQITDFGSLDGKVRPRVFAEQWEHPIDPRIAPGAWCIVRHRSLVDSGDETDRTFFVRQDEIEAVITVDLPKD